MKVSTSKARQGVAATTPEGQRSPGRIAMTPDLRYQFLRQASGSSLNGSFERLDISSAATGTASSVHWCILEPMQPPSGHLVCREG